MEDQQAKVVEGQSPKRRKIVLFVAVVTAGLALCTAMKSVICGKSRASCPCQALSDQMDDGCESTAE